MRPLTEDESKALFTKLANYIVCVQLVSLFYLLTPLITREKISSISLIDLTSLIASDYTRTGYFMSPNRPCVWGLR
jgi:hypothetical protein